MNLFNGKKRFILVGHSFGGCVAIEFAKLLERNGLTGQIISIDGSVTVFKRGMNLFLPKIGQSDENLENYILMHMAFELVPDLQMDVLQKIIFEHKTWDEQIAEIVKLVDQPEYSSVYLKNIGVGILNRIRMIMKESDEYSGERIQSNITLIRPTAHLVPDMENDYHLKQYTNGRVLVSFIEGDHMTMLDNIQLYQIINSICTS